MVDVDSYQMPQPFVVALIAGTALLTGRLTGGGLSISSCLLPDRVDLKVGGATASVRSGSLWG